jgi:hypothetical protein
MTASRFLIVSLGPLFFMAKAQPNFPPLYFSMTGAWQDPLVIPTQCRDATAPTSGGSDPSAVPQLGNSPLSLSPRITSASNRAITIISINDSMWSSAVRSCFPPYLPGFPSLHPPLSLSLSLPHCGITWKSPATSRLRFMATVRSQGRTNASRHCTLTPALSYATTTLHDPRWDPYTNGFPFFVLLVEFRNVGHRCIAFSGEVLVTPRSMCMAPPWVFVIVMGCSKKMICWPLDLKPWSLLDPLDTPWYGLGSPKTTYPTMLVHDP